MGLRVEGLGRAGSMLVYGAPIGASETVRFNNGQLIGSGATKNLWKTLTS